MNNKKMAVSLAMFCFILALCLMVINVSGEKLTYEDGYEDGVKAAKEDADQAGTYLSTNPKQPTPPPSTMEKIKDKPKQYREGFLAGYKSTFPREANTSFVMWGLFLGLMAALGLFVGLLVQ